MESTINHIDVIESAATRISGLARSSELKTPVEHLGRWKVRDVVAHLGGVHRWATRIIINRSMDGPSFTKSKLDGVELCDWFDACACGLIEALKENGSAEECPNFNPGSPATVEWWARRQMHEAVIHRWDIEQALGCPTPIAADVGADGIDEFLDVFIRTRGKQTLIAPLVLATTKPSRTWTLTPGERPGRVDVSLDGSTTVEAELSGPPEKLLLTLWGRLSISDAGLAINGDHEIANSLVGRPDDSD